VAKLFLSGECFGTSLSPTLRCYAPTDVIAHHLDKYVATNTDPPPHTHTHTQIRVSSLVVCACAHLFVMDIIIIPVFIDLF
jgi:hypothetical protein